MGSYLSSTDHQQKAMLDEIGYKDYDDLFGCVPDSVKLKGRLSIPEGKSELELRRQMESLAGKNRVFDHVFRGAGAYRHYIPAIVKDMPYLFMKNSVAFKIHMNRDTNNWIPHNRIQEVVTWRNYRKGFRKTA